VSERPRFLSTLLIGALAGLVAGGAFLAGILRPLDEKILDLEQRWVVSNPASTAPLLLASVEDLEGSPWPWSRLDFTLVTNALRPFFPRMLAVEIPLDDPDTFFPIYDIQLSGYLKRMNLLTLSATGSPYGDTAAPPASTPLIPLPEGGADRFYQFKSGRFPLPLYQDTGAGIGFDNLIRESDGMVRRVPLFFRYGDQLVPSFALEAYAQFLGVYWPGSEVRPGDSVILRGAEKQELARIPLDNEGCLRLRFRPGPLRSPDFECRDIIVSSEQAKRGEPTTLNLREVRDKLVLLGRNNAKIVPPLPTPSGDASPAVIQLNVLRNLFEKDYIRETPLWALIPLFLLTGLCGAMLTLFTRPLPGILLLATGSVVLAIASWMVFDSLNCWAPFLSPILSAFIAWGAGLLWQRLPQGEDDEFTSVEKKKE
jgi:adenylate cyclase